MLGFDCVVYKQAPQARIFVDNKLLDEFYVNHNGKDTDKELSYESIGKKNILEPVPRLEKLKLYLRELPDLKFYDIELHKSIDSLSIHIDIQNDDNNFNNGFMTKYTALTLKVCNFFPLNNELMEPLINHNRKRLFLNYGWYQKKNFFKNVIFHLAENGMKWLGKNWQIIDSQNLTLYKIGESGTFTCNLVKKYGVFLIKKTKPYIFNFNHTILDYFNNKYQQHENQRNHN